MKSGVRVRQPPGGAASKLWWTDENAARARRGWATRALRLRSLQQYCVCCLKRFVRSVLNSRFLHACWLKCPVAVCLRCFQNCTLVYKSDLGSLCFHCFLLPNGQLFNVYASALLGLFIANLYENAVVASKTDFSALMHISILVLDLLQRQAVTLRCLRWTNLLELSRPEKWRQC